MASYRLSAQEQPDTVPPVRSAAHHYLPLSNYDDFLVNSLLLSAAPSRRVHYGVRPWRSDTWERMTWDGDTIATNRVPLRNFSSPETGPGESEEWLAGKGDSKTWRWIHDRLFNTSLFYIREKDSRSPERYALSINPVFNLETGAVVRPGRQTTLLNGRGIWVTGKVDKFSFYTMIAENQGDFPAYYTSRYRARRHALGWGWAKNLQQDRFDFAQAMGEVAWKPNTYFLLSLGHGKQFWGEGYRSLFLSDYALPQTYFKLETTIGAVRYVNLWSVYMDNTDPARFDGINYRKYTASHLLSWNITSRWNFTLFESIVLAGDTTTAIPRFDISFLNPVIFYRTLEYSAGFRSGNAIMGAGSAYTIGNGLRIYGQFVLDDFFSEAFRRRSEGHWLNLYGSQLGIRYGGLWPRGNYLVAVEYNQVRPFVYSHRSSLSNYSHLGEPIAHPRGSGFNELLVHARVRYRRWIGELYLSGGVSGTDTSGVNLGNDIFRSYRDRVWGDTGYFFPTGQPVRTYHVQISAGYLVNIATGLRLEAGVRLRRAVADWGADPAGASHGWVFAGLHTPLFNRYLDE